MATRYRIVGAQRETGTDVETIVRAASEDEARAVAYERGIVVASVRRVERRWIAQGGIVLAAVALILAFSALDLIGLPGLVIALVVGCLVLLVAITRTGEEGRDVAPYAMLHALVAAVYTAVAALAAAIALIGISFSGFSGGPSTETKAIAAAAGWCVLAGLLWNACSLVALTMRSSRPRASLLAPVVPCAIAAGCVMQFESVSMTWRVGLMIAVAVPLIASGLGAVVRWNGRTKCRSAQADEVRKSGEVES